VIRRSTDSLSGPAALSAGPGRGGGRVVRVVAASRAIRDRGASPIEIAILLPVIVMALFASIQVSVYFLAKSEAESAAQICVTVQRGYQAPAGAGAKAAGDYLAGGSAGNWLSGWTISCNTPAKTVGVTGAITGNAPSLIPGFNVGVSVTVHGTIEAPAPPPPSPSIPPPSPGPPVPTP
jgi:hypothetical protein